MRAIDSATDLRRRLADAGIEVADDAGAGADARSAWEAFCTAALEAVDEPFEVDGVDHRVSYDGGSNGGDLLLHESHEEHGRFLLTFTRQFSYTAANGEQAEMQGLALGIEFEGEGACREARADRWGYAGRRQDDDPDDYVDAWKAKVEASRSFRAFGELTPVGFWFHLFDY